jgi:hypothetical protein
MSHKPAQTPCLGARVSALADGSLRPDVRDRALAHTLTCPSCRDALDVERLTVERLRSLSDPEPSSALLATLYSMGDPGGPVPARRGFGPGMPRPVLVTVGPVGPPSMVAPVRPGGSTHPGNRTTGRRMRRSVVVVAAGALGMGAVTAGVLGSAVGVTAVGSQAQLSVQSPSAGGSGSSVQQSEQRSRLGGSAVLGQSSFGQSSFGQSSFGMRTAAFSTSGLGTSALGTSAFANPVTSALRSPGLVTSSIRLGNGEQIAHGHPLSH